jgi:hypothetical protein
MRYAEFALLLVPVGLIVAWLFGVRGLSTRGTVAALLLLAAMGGGLLWLGIGRSFTGRYVPAQLEGTRIEAGHPG